jgi:hypothetical protein
VVPPEITAACQAVNAIPPIIPDIPGWTGHITFTNTSLLVQIQTKCRAEQQAQMDLLNLQNVLGLWMDSPWQFNNLQNAAAKVQQSAANYRMAQELLAQLSLDAGNLKSVEHVSDAAQGRNQMIQAGTMVNASAANTLLKMATLQATSVQADQASTQNAAQHLRDITSAASPDFGDGWML